MEVWDLIKPEFLKQENWGDPDYMDDLLLFILYNIRCDLEIRINVHCGCEERKSGYHPTGKACDFHFITGMNLRTQYVMLEDYLKHKGWDTLVGLGVYPDWNTPGFHLDARGERARWGRIYHWINNHKVRKYVSIDEAFEWMK